MIPEASDQTGQPYQPPAFGDPPVQDGKRMGRKNRKWMLVAGAILVVLAVGAARYFLLRFHKTTPPPAQSSNSSSQQPAVAPDTTADSTEQTYVSNGTDLNLSFTYPSAWNVSPPTNNNSSDQPITVTSPRVSLRSAAGAAVTGKIVVSIRPGSADISELGSSATAAQASVQFAYSKPSSSQHQYPYLTFIHLKSGTNPSGIFEEVMITGTTTFNTGQAITNGSLGQLDPIISARFYTCTDALCDPSSAPPLGITYSTWQDDGTLKQVQVLFESLQLR